MKKKLNKRTATIIDQIMQHYDIEKMSSKLGEISRGKTEYSEGSTYEAV